VDLKISTDIVQILNLADKTVVIWNMDLLKEKKKKEKAVQLELNLNANFK